MSMRSEFEVAFMADVVERHGQASADQDGWLERNSNGEYRSFMTNGAWWGWQTAMREVQPEWRPMSELPPFPFRGDICCDGKIIINADWAGGGKDHGYWQSPKGDRSIDLVSHWKPSNKPIFPPDGVAP